MRKTKFGTVLLGIVISAMLMGCMWGLDDLSNASTYKGKPVYQFDVENDTIEIDGVMYRAVWGLPKKTVRINDQLTTDVINLGEMIGYIWYEPHVDMEGGMIYTLWDLTDHEDGEYLYGQSYAANKVKGVSKRYSLPLKKVE